MITHFSTFLLSLVAVAILLIPLKSVAYDSFWGYYVCYDENTRGKVGSCILSTTICHSHYLHYYGQYNDRDQWRNGLLRCNYSPSTVVDPVARTWRK